MAVAASRQTMERYGLEQFLDQRGDEAAAWRGRQERRCGSEMPSKRKRDRARVIVVVTLRVHDGMTDEM